MLSRSVLERLEVRSWKLHLGNSDLRHWLEHRVRNWDGRHKGGVEIGIEEVTSWSVIPNGLMIVSLLFQSHTLFWFRHHGLIQCVCVCVWGLKVYFSFCQCVISPLCVCMCEEKKCVLAGVSTDGSVFCCLVCIHVNCLQHWRVCALFFFFSPFTTPVSVSEIVTGSGSASHSPGSEHNQYFLCVCGSRRPLWEWGGGKGGN